MLGALEAVREIAGWPRSDLSEQQLVSCMYGDLGQSTDWCRLGADNREVLRYLRDFQVRVTTENQWRYTSGSTNQVGTCSQRPSSGATVSDVVTYTARGSRDEIKTHLQQRPVVFSMYMLDETQNCECTLGLMAVCLCRLGATGLRVVCDWAYLHRVHNSPGSWPQP